MVDCQRGQRRHRIAEEYLVSHSVGTGVFLILVARAPATVWDVHRSKEVIGNIAKRTAFVNHYSFSHHGSAVGASDDQDVRASPVRRTDHSQWR